MARTALRGRLVFCFAVALTAAALADALVEALSDAGVFGPDVYTDRSYADMMPALSVGILLAVAFTLALARRISTPDAPAPGWVRRAADATRLAPAQLIVTFGLQIGALCAMETLEQVAVWGHPLGGNLWIGGPIPISLALHAAIGIGVAFAFSRVLSWLAIRVARVLHLVACLQIALAQPPTIHLAVGQLVVRCPAERARRRLRGRAPPLRPVMT